MKQYSREQLEKVAGQVGKIPHLQALKEGIPEILEPIIDNTIADKDIPAEGTFTTAVFNLQRGDYIDETIAFFKQHRRLSKVNIILANELDWGMARTKNLNTTKEIAQALGMNYVFANEFITMSAGQNGNREGLHGNAILSDYPLDRVAVVPLAPKYEWLHRENDPRLGLRTAVFAQVTIDGKEIGLVCVHLENRCTPEQRREQVEALLDDIDEYFGDIPVIIGGDMNTNTVDGDSDTEMEALNDDVPEQWIRIAKVADFEPQLGYIEERGYSYKDCNIIEKVTRRKPMVDGQTMLLNLDWFYQRGLNCSNPIRVESIFRTSSLSGETESLKPYEARELSDHDIILVDSKV